MLDRDNDKKSQFVQAIEQAQNSEYSIDVAYSNHSFELWLLLHFNYVDTAQMQADLEKKLSKCLGVKKYDKTDPNIYRQITDGGGDLKQAINHSKRLLSEKTGINPADANPSTKVHLLILELLRH